MQQKQGIPVSPGMVVAEAFVLDTEELQIPRRIRDREAAEELRRFNDAVQKSIDEIEALRHTLPDAAERQQLGMVFDGHIMILKDPTLTADVKRRIELEKHTAEYAVTRTFNQYKKVIRNLRSSAFAQRVSDFNDIERRILRHLLGATPLPITSFSGPVVLFAQDLSPSQITELDRVHVVGIATDQGGATSHSAILANALNIPAIVGLGDITQRVTTGDSVILDASRGVIVINPDAETLARFETSKREVSANRERLLAEAKALPAQTSDGCRVRLLANIEFIDEIPTAVQLGAEGVGLFRTEFLYATAGGTPSEATHFETYRSALEMLGGRPLVIRTMDLGADKFGGELELGHEPNPALGLRSVRLSLRHPELFQVQLRAIVRASAYGPVSVMFPMVSHIREVRDAKQALWDVMAELRRDGVTFAEKIPVGIMVEVPAVAVCAERFAKEVEFFSIGTNDLIQYTLAVDRLNPEVASLFQADHPAVLALIERTVKAASNAGIPCTICGEMAADPKHTQVLLGFGLRNLSVSPKAIPQLKHNLSVIRMEAAREAAQAVLTQI